MTQPKKSKMCAFHAIHFAQHHFIWVVSLPRYESHLILFTFSFPMESIFWLGFGLDQQKKKRRPKYRTMFCIEAICITAQNQLLMQVRPFISTWFSFYIFEYIVAVYSLVLRQTSKSQTEDRKYSVTHIWT